MTFFQKIKAIFCSRPELPFLLLVFFAVQAQFYIPSVSAEEARNELVLFLNSYHKGYPWSDNITRAVEDVFNHSGRPIELYVRYLDMKRINEPWHVERLKDLYQESFRNIHFNTILVSDNDAFDFIRKYGDELFPGVPVVFCGVNNFHDELLSGHTNFTGVNDEKDYKETIEVALKLQPGIRTIVVVTDNTTTGIAHRQAVEQETAGMPPGIKIQYLSLGDSTMEELGAKLAALHTDSVVLLLSHFRDKDGRAYPHDQSVKYLARRSAAPCYVVTDTRLGLGVIGGKISSGYYQGEVAARMVLRILSGEEVRNIPVVRQSPNRYMFDHQAMRRFRISERHLPPGSIIINRPQTLFEQYRLQFITAGGAFVILVIFNFLMVMEVRRRKRAERKAKDLVREWENTFNAIRDPISIHDKDFKVVRVNRAFEELCGLRNGDVIGRKCYELVHGCGQPPEQCPHLKLAGNFGPRVEEFYEAKLDKYFEVSVWPRQDHLGKLIGVVHAMKDITERKKMEQALTETSDKLKGIFRAAPTGIGVVVNRVFKEANDRLCEMTGYSREEIIGKSSRIVYVTDEDYEFVGREKYRMIAEKGTGTVETRWRRKDGQVISILLSSTPLDPKDQSLGVTFTALDITERDRAESALRVSEAYLRSILDNAPTLMWLKDVEGRFLTVNEPFAVASGRKDPAELVGKTDFDFWPRELSEKYRADDREVMETRHKKNVEELICIDGVSKWFETYKTPILDASGEVIGTVGFARDITERKEAEQALAKERNLLRMLIDNLPDSIYVKDREGRKILTNRADLDFIGVEHEGQVLGKTDAEVYPEHLSAKYHQDDQVVIQHGRAVINREEVVEDASGIRRWLLTSKLPVKDGEGQITGLIGIGRDITERKHLESKLLTMAHYDMLTKLPNRTLFFERSNTGISQAKRTGVSCAVLFVDLDHFKSVNDTLGHTIGDELLKDTAVKLVECVRETDTIARLGGDEFIIFLNGLETAQGAQHIAERIRERFNTPRQVAGNDLFITASIGIATFPNDGENLEELLKNADAAMYAAKDSGRNTFCFFDSRMNQKAVTKMQIERGLRDALAKSEFRLFYQPILGIQNGKIRGFEALLRWFRSEGGLVTPNEFIPVAEDTGLIVPIGEWVLQQACRFNKRLIDSGYGKLVMSVNISVAQLRRKNIIDSIRDALQVTGLPPECLEIEVTESILIQSFDAALEVLKGIRELGVQVSLDDFGTGYSSLSHLQRLPIANLKIDRLFIKEIVQESEENDLTPAIIELAHKLKLKVVAEGVETDLQLGRLSRDHCDYYQGFLFCKPLPEDKVLAFLEENRARLS
jgi:diguanylate cyclase (GGDEF)-like protein/PAS domain S-box-containing protein